MGSKFVYRPFQPGESIQNEDGSHSTERTMTVEDNMGGYMVIPSLWMGPDKHIDLLEHPASARKLAIQYEAHAGKYFPRFSTINDADEYAERRSQKGGAEQGEIAR
jgi:hypothetical protein